MWLIGSSVISVPLSCGGHAGRKKKKNSLHNRSSLNQSNKNSSSYVQCFCKEQILQSWKDFQNNFLRIRIKSVPPGCWSSHQEAKYHHQQSYCLVLSERRKQTLTDARGDCLIPLRRAGSSTEPPASVYQRLIHDVYLTMSQKYSEACSVLYFTLLDVSV